MILRTISNLLGDNEPGRKEKEREKRAIGAKELTDRRGYVQVWAQNMLSSPPSALAEILVHLHLLNILIEFYRHTTFIILIHKKSIRFVKRKYDL